MTRASDKILAFGLYSFAVFLPVSITFAQLSLMFLIAVWILSSAANLKSGYSFFIVDPIIVALLLWIFIAAFFSVHPEVTFSKIGRYWKIGSRCTRRPGAEMPTAGVETFAIGDTLTMFG